MDIIRSIAEIRQFFQQNRTPIYHVAATNFNLLSIDEWVGEFRFISYIDCYDGRHPHNFTPRDLPNSSSKSHKSQNAYLLEHKEVFDYITKRGGDPKFTFLMFDHYNETLVDEEYDAAVWFPPAAMRTALDDKIETVRIGNQAGVPSVPNVLAAVDSYETLCEQARDLGNDLVLQTSYGDSGATTFFIACAEDFARHREDVVAAGEIKIMKRIACRQVAIEACITRCGVVVAPPMTELIGFPELTPYPGGWCGNELGPDLFDEATVAELRRKTVSFGEELLRRGYRGYFELDFLIDTNDGEIYLGELNPRLSGCASLVNQGSFARADVPLFLLHLLEFSAVEFDIDTATINARWTDPGNIDSWSQIIIKYTEKNEAVVAEAPATGIWHLSATIAEYQRFGYGHAAVSSDDEAFFLRIARRGDYLYPGSDLGILTLRGRAMDSTFTINERSHRWIHAIRQQFQWSQR